MKLQDQVCSLDLAKRLKELGVKQESLFYWQFWSERPDDVMVRYVKDMSSHREVQSVAAFTVAELGEMLPIFRESWPDKPREWWCENQPLSRDAEDNKKRHSEEAHTEADARAKMLVYLIENTIVTA